MNHGLQLAGQQPADFQHRYPFLLGADVSKANVSKKWIPSNTRVGRSSHIHKYSRFSQELRSSYSIKIIRLDPPSKITSLRSLNTSVSHYSTSSSMPKALGPSDSNMHMSLLKASNSVDLGKSLTMGYQRSRFSESLNC